MPISFKFEILTARRIRVLLQVLRASRRICAGIWTYGFSQHRLHKVAITANDTLPFFHEVVGRCAVCRAVVPCSIRLWNWIVIGAVASMTADS